MTSAIASPIRQPQRFSIPPRRPLKQRVYPQSKMTIAAGFTNHNGVLLCADTLTTDGAGNVIYRSKIMPVFLRDGTLLFAFAGNVRFCESAIERCAVVLRKYNGSPRSMDQMAEQIRRAWFKAFKESHPRDEYSEDQILCAIQSNTDGAVALYCTSNKNFSRPPTDVECIGYADSLTRYLVSPKESFSSYRALSEQHAFEIAAAAIGRVKDFMPGSVGGHTTAVNLRPDGRYKLYGIVEIDLIERYTREFDEAVVRLNLEFMDFEHPSSFASQTDHRMALIRTVKREWEELRDGPVFKQDWHIPPQELIDAFQRARQLYPIN